MSLFPELGSLGGFDLITVDYPWPHNNYGQAKHGAPSYRCLPLEDGERMPVGELASEAGALLFMWGTGPQAADQAVFRLMRAWGFVPRTKIFSWVKINRACAACGHPFEDHAAPEVHGPLAAGACATADGINGCDVECRAFAVSTDYGPGNYSGGNTEDVWLGIKPGPATWSVSRARRDVRQVIFAPAPDVHSRKPEAMQDRVEALWPGRRSLELFARRSRPGTVCWGGELPDSVPVFGEAVGSWWPSLARASPSHDQSELPFDRPCEV
jgi:N6-adenosine-specific RNA methylase IME4